MPGHPTVLDNSRASAHWASNRCGGHFLSRLSVLFFSPPLGRRPDIDRNAGSTALSGWSGGAKVLGKLSVPGRPTSLDDSRARAYCACSRCGWGLFGHFFSHLSFLFSLSPSLGDGPI